MAARARDARLQAPTAVDFPGRQPSLLARAVPASFPHPLSGADPSLEDLFRRVSPEFATVRGIVKARGKASGPLVVHLQDVHHHAEAQMNLAAVVRSLSAGRESRVVVALEGAFGPLDLDRFRSFPDPGTVRVVADNLLSRHDISGPVHALLSHPGPAPVAVGIDDPAHYQANVEAFRRSSPLIEARKATLKERRRDLDTRKARAYSPTLADFDASLQAYHSGTLSLGDYARVLATALPAVEGPLQTFLRALRMEESLDFKQVEEDRTRLVEALVRRLDKGRLDAFMDVTIAYRLGRMSHGDYYGRLTSLCTDAGVALAATPAMDAYVRYVLLSDRISAEALFEAVRRGEAEALRRLARSEEERHLTAEDRRLHLTDRLVDFSLTPREWVEYRSFGASPEADDAGFEAFYLEAHARDAAMAENALRAAEGADVLLLVAGGFHGPGLADKLSAAGCTVVAVVPQLSQIDGHSGAVYLSAFAREKSPLAVMVEGDKLFLPTPVWPTWVNEAGFALKAVLVAAVRLPGMASQKVYDLLASRRAVMSPVKTEGQDRWFHAAFVGGAFRVQGRLRSAATDADGLPGVEFLEDEVLPSNSLWRTWRDRLLSFFNPAARRGSLAPAMDVPYALFPARQAPEKDVFPRRELVPSVLLMVNDGRDGRAPPPAAPLLEDDSERQGQIKIHHAPLEVKAIVLHKLAPHDPAWLEQYADLKLGRASAVDGFVEAFLRKIEEHGIHKDIQDHGDDWVVVSVTEYSLARTPPFLMAKRLAEKLHLGHVDVTAGELAALHEDTNANALSPAGREALGKEARRIFGDEAFRTLSALRLNGKKVLVIDDTVASGRNMVKYIRVLLDDTGVKAVTPLVVAQLPGDRKDLSEDGLLEARLPRHMGLQVNFLAELLNSGTEGYPARLVQACLRLDKRFFDRLLETLNADALRNLYFSSFQFASDHPKNFGRLVQALRTKFKKSYPGPEVSQEIQRILPDIRDLMEGVQYRVQTNEQADTLLRRLVDLIGEAKNLGNDVDRQARDIILAIAIYNHGGPFDLVNRNIALSGIQDRIARKSKWTGVLHDSNRFTRDVQEPYQLCLAAARFLNAEPTSHRAAVLRKVYSAWLQDATALMGGYREDYARHAAEASAWIKAKVPDDAVKNDLLGRLERGPAIFDRITFNNNALHHFLSVKRDGLLASGLLMPFSLKAWLTEHDASSGRRWFTKWSDTYVAPVRVIVPEGPLPRVLADPILLHVPVERLIENAREHIGKNSGEITITLRRSPIDDDRLQLVISNRGAFPEELLTWDEKASRQNLHVLKLARKEVEKSIGGKTAYEMLDSMGARVYAWNDADAGTANVVVDLPTVPDGVERTPGEYRNRVLAQRRHFSDAESLRQAIGVGPAVLSRQAYIGGFLQKLVSRRQEGKRFGLGQETAGVIGYVVEELFYSFVLLDVLPRLAAPALAGMDPQLTRLSFFMVRNIVFGLRHGRLWVRDPLTGKLKDMGPARFKDKFVAMAIGGFCSIGYLAGWSGAESFQWSALSHGVKNFVLPHFGTSSRAPGLLHVQAMITGPTSGGPAVEKIAAEWALLIEQAKDGRPEDAAKALRALLAGGALNRDVSSLLPSVGTAAARMARAHGVNEARLRVALASRLSRMGLDVNGVRGALHGMEVSEAGPFREALDEGLLSRHRGEGKEASALLTFIDGEQVGLLRAEGRAGEDRLRGLILLSTADFQHEHRVLVVSADAWGQVQDAARVLSLSKDRLSRIRLTPGAFQGSRPEGTYRLVLKSAAEGLSDVLAGAASVQGISPKHLPVDTSGLPANSILAERRAVFHLIDQWLRTVTVGILQLDAIDRHARAILTAA